MSIVDWFGSQLGYKVSLTNAMLVVLLFRCQLLVWIHRRYTFHWLPGLACGWGGLLVDIGRR